MWKAFGLAAILIAVIGKVAVPPTPAAVPIPGACVGDCGADGTVTVDEVIKMVGIALGNDQLSACPAGDSNDDHEITVDEIIKAVNNVLTSCPPTPTPTPSPTPTPLPHTLTPTITNTPTPTPTYTRTPACPAPVITSIDPTSGSVGTAATITGSNLDCAGVGNVQLSCGGQPMAITFLSPTTIRSVIPPGAQDCHFSLTTEGGAVTAPDNRAFDVIPSRNFSLSLTPAAGTVIQGSSTTYSVSATGTNGFSDLITLNVTGFPTGVTAILSPGTITTGQSATVLVQAADAATAGSATLSFSGTARIDGSDSMRSTTATLTVRPKGQTSLVGRVLNTEGAPIKGVAIRVHDKTAYTDDSGNFLLQDPPTGDQVVLVDGGPASTPDTPYPTIPVSMTIAVGTTNELPYAPHLHVQKNYNFTTIDRMQDTVATDPGMPDTALRIPAGTDIVGWDGQRNTKVSMRTVPIGSLPVPPPPPQVSAKTVFMFFFGKQGGGTPSQPIPFTAPNDLGLTPGDKADLWYFDESPNLGEAPNDWRVAGTGTVSADGKTIVSDPGVGIPKFCCGASLWNPRQRENPQQGGQTPQLGQGTSAGDPVDLSTGIFMFTATDMVLPGRIPVAITRTYRSGDSVPGPFGLGTTMSYDDFLEQTSSSVLTYVYRGNARTQFFRQPDGSFVNTTVPAFRGARIVPDAEGARALRFKDGTALVFDSSGLPVRVRDRNQNEVVIQRPSEFDPNTIAEPSGRTLNLSWQGAQRDRITLVTDPIGRTVGYQYDGQNRLVAATDPAGGVTRYAYDSQNRMTSITDARGITYIKNTYDANGRICEQEQADAGKFRFAYITSDRATLPAIPLLPIVVDPTLFSCNAPASNGIVVATVVADPLGHLTLYRFNGAGYVVSVTDALGQPTQMEREEETNLLLSTTDPLGRVSQFAYDDAGNIASLTDPAGNVRGFEYDATFNRLTKFTDPLGNVATFHYDRSGNLIGITDPEQNRKPEAERLQTHISYNQFGQPTAVIDVLGNVTSFAYDAQGDLAAIIDPLGNTSTRAYDLVSRLTAQTDARNKTTRFAYDDLNRITQITDALTGATAFAYDPNGNLLTVTDALSHTTTYAYNNTDRMISRTDPVGAAEFFEYDAAGNLIQHTDRKNQVSAYTYDPLNRRVGANYADATTSFVYDAAGRLVQATDSAGGTILDGYDVLDRLAQETTALGTIQYQYDALGRRTSMSVPGQDPVGYEYDANSGLTRITQGDQVVNFTYDVLGRRTQLTLPNGVSTEYDYDAASRLTELVYRNGTGGVLGNLTSEYDSLGNRTHVGGSWARALLPDPVASATYDAANRQLQFGDKQMSFDANGSLTNITEPTGTTTLTWDARTRLMSLTAPGSAASFAYDPFGRRVSKEFNGQASQYVYDAFDIVRELSGRVAIDTLRSLNIDEPLVRAGEGYLADALGSITALTDGSGTTMAQYTYEPFGRTAGAGATANPFQYVGRENDQTKMYYFRARYYHPTMGRFISEDPLAFTLPGNPYEYGRNRPLSLTDPYGLRPLRGNQKVTPTWEEVQAWLHALERLGIDMWWFSMWPGWEQDIWPANWAVTAVYVPGVGAADMNWYVGHRYSPSSAWTSFRVSTEIVYTMMEWAGLGGWRQVPWRAKLNNTLQNLEGADLGSRDPYYWWAF